MCFSADLGNKCSYIFSVTFIFILLYISYAQIKLLVFVAQSFKKNQESLYYIRPTDFRFLVG